MKVLIVYYSTYGNVYKMAKLVAEGVSEVKRAEPVVRRVPELMPAELIESDEDMKRGRDMQKDVREVTMEDFVAIEEPDRPARRALAEGGFRGKAGGSFRLDIESSRRAGDDDSQLDGSAAASGDGACRRALLD